MFCFIYSSAFPSDSELFNLLSSFSDSFNNLVISRVLSNILFYNAYSCFSVVSKLTLSLYAYNFLSWENDYWAFKRFFSISSYMSTYNGGRFCLPKSTTPFSFESIESALVSFISSGSLLTVESSLKVDERKPFFSMSSSSTFSFFLLENFYLRGLYLSLYSSIFDFGPTWCFLL